MTQTSKKEKMKIQERQDIHKLKSSIAPSKEENAHYFVKDVRRSLTLVAIILLVMIGIYIASRTNMIPFIPQV